MQQVIKFLCYKFLYPCLYYVLSKRKTDMQKLVFVEPSSDHLTNSLKTVFDSLCNRNTYKTHLFFLNQNNTHGIAKIKKDLKLICLVSNASCVFIDDTCLTLSCFKLRSDTRLVQLWHACGAFKKFGWSAATLPFGPNQKEHERYPSHKNYFFVTTSSAEVVKWYCEAMSIKSEQVLPVGVSRTDKFFDKNYVEASRRRLLEKYPLLEGKKIILYAPTYRGNISSVHSGNGLDVDYVANRLGKEYVILVKYHPFVLAKPICKTKVQLIDVSGIDIDELFCISDICVTDYSSLIFEFSLFCKPMIFFAYDLDEYSAMRGFYYNYEEFVPGPIVKTNEELVHEIQSNHLDKDKIDNFRMKFMHACDGHSTERILKILNL